MEALPVFRLSAVVEGRAERTNAIFQGVFTFMLVLDFCSEFGLLSSVYR